MCAQYKAARVLLLASGAYLAASTGVEMAATLGSGFGSSRLLVADVAMWSAALLAVVGAVLGQRLYRQERRKRQLLERQSRALRESTLELEATVAKLREGERLRNRFFANVNHELRTPLTLILAPLEATLTHPEELSPGTLERLTLMQRNAKGLLALVNDLLDISRLEAGRMSLNLVATDMRELADAVLKPFQALATLRGIRLSLAGASGSFSAVDVDKAATVLRNLLSNAIKFTPEGGEVTVTVGCGAEHVSIEVSDTGIGIPPESQEMIFDRFAQAGEAGRRLFGGTGIGLALAKELVELHGGTITVRSEPSVGSTFRVCLPRLAQLDSSSTAELEVQPDPPRPGSAAKASAARPCSAPGEDRRPTVLVVEDNEEMRTMLAELLDGHYQVLAAEDGRAGFASALRDRPDVIISDVIMPECSGHEMVQALKADQRTQAIPIILLTADHSAEAVLECFACGADDYVSKPFEIDDLRARIGTQLEAHSAVPRNALPVSPAAPHGQDATQTDGTPATGRLA